MAAMDEVHEKLINEYIAANRRLVVSRNGKIEEVDPREYLPKIRRVN
jgi:hypothetical protein